MKNNLKGKCFEPFEYGLEKVSYYVYSLSYVSTGVSIPLSRKGLGGTCIWRDEPH